MEELDARIEKINKENYIEERRELYVDRMNENRKVKENIHTTEMQDLKKIQKIAIKYKNNDLMGQLRTIVEKQLNRYVVRAEVELQDEEEM